MNINAGWLSLAFVSLICVTVIDLCKKYILDKNAIQPNELIIYSAMIMGVIGGCHFIHSKECRNFNKFDNNICFLIILIGIISYLFNIFFTNSIKLAPNAGFTGMIISLNIIFIYLFSSLFFEKSPIFNFKIFFGLISIVFGINIVLYNI